MRRRSMWGGLVLVCNDTMTPFRAVWNQAAVAGDDPAVAATRETERTAASRRMILVINCFKPCSWPEFRARADVHDPPARTAARAPEPGYAPTHAVKPSRATAREDGAAGAEKEKRHRDCPQRREDDDPPCADIAVARRGRPVVDQVP